MGSYLRSGTSHTVKREWIRWRTSQAQVAIFLLSAATLLPCGAQLREPAESTVSVCELLNRLDQYSGRTVRIAAPLSAALDAFLVGENCPSKIGLGAIEVPNFVAVRWPSNRSTKTHMPFETNPEDEQLFEKTLETYDSTRENLSIDLEGLVVTRDPPYALVPHRNPPSNGGIRPPRHGSRRNRHQEDPLSA